MDVEPMGCLSLEAHMSNSHPSENTFCHSYPLTILSVQNVKSLQPYPLAVDTLLQSGVSTFLLIE
jgi:hypothetical protein